MPGIGVDRGHRAPTAAVVLRPLRFRDRLGRLLVATASTITPLAIALLVLYPVFDVAAAVVDARSSNGVKPGLYVNIAISLLAAIGLAVAASSGNPGVLRVWGAWAILSGLVQLVVGLSRRALGGQWPMIISGAISTVAGISFILQAGQQGAGLSTLAGYATLGGIFFLVSALRLGRAAKA
ncbi:integral membrane protein [Kutzneria sp. 744]|nr:integral membrane protein [Kutzneria sp. 744]